MNERNIAFIGIRLLIIFLAIQIINMLPQLFASLVFSLQSLPLYYTLLFLAVPVVAVCLIIVFWALSGKIANFLIKKLPVNNDARVTERSDLQAVLFCTVGLFIFITTIPDIIGWLYDLQRAFYLESKQLYPKWPPASDIIVLSIKMLLSIIIMFKASILSKIFYKLRYSGLAR